MGSTTNPDFLTVAVSRKMLSQGQSRELSIEAAKLGVQPSQLAVEKGFLDSAQVDIIGALANPKDIAPGYEILDVLGYGGLGVVYRARQLTLDRIIALKTVLLSRMERPGMLARFELEAKSVGKLRHPNVVTAYDYGTHEGRLFLAMEMVDGEDLDELLQRVERLDETTAWSIARQTASGLAHAAEADIVHRDIKPANLMLTRPPQGYTLPAGVPMVKITDFGLAFLTAETENQTRLTIAGTTMGTPQYMAPEQLSEPTVDIRADIYALGATMYHLLAGVPPFEGDTTGQVLANKIRGNIRDLAELVDGVSHATVKLVEAMMAADPANRPADYAELIDRIDGLAHISHDVLHVARNRVAKAETVLDTSESSRATPDQVVAPRRNSLLLVLGRMLMLSLLLVALAGLAYAMRGDQDFKILIERLQSIHLFGQSTSSDFEGPVLIEGTWQKSLFSGKDLSGWSKSRGVWRAARDADGKAVLVGTSGQISCPLPVPPKKADGTTGDYSFRLKLDLRDARAAEIHFSVVNRGERYVLRAGRNGVVLGRLAWESRSFLPVTEKIPFPPRSQGLDKTEYHELRIGKHRTHWLAHFDGQLVGTLPVMKTQEIMSIGLVVEKGTAHFKSPRVAELTPRR